MGSGVPVVDRSRYLPTRDTQHTFRLSSPCTQIPCSARAQQEPALLAHAVQGVGDVATPATAFMMTVSGFVEAASQAMLREQTMSERSRRTAPKDFRKALADTTRAADPIVGR
jgi:hypothetical protein